MRGVACLVFLLVASATLAVPAPRPRPGKAAAGPFEIDFTPPWPRKGMVDLIREHAGLDLGYVQVDGEGISLVAAGAAHQRGPEILDADHVRGPFLVGEADRAGEDGAEQGVGADPAVEQGQQAGDVLLGWRSGRRVCFDACVAVDVRHAS